MPPKNNSTKELAKALQEYRHVLLNGTAAIQRSLRQIELRFEYMSEASDIFNKALENSHDSTEGKADEN